jgi:hypothetical protein
MTPDEIIEKFQKGEVSSKEVIILMIENEYSIAEISEVLNHGKLGWQEIVELNDLFTYLIKSW